MSEPEPDLQWMLHDIRDRYWHSLGHPPALIYANRDFGRQLFDQLERQGFPFIHQNNLDWLHEVRHGEFEYAGMRVLCSLNTNKTTLTACARCVAH